MNDNQPGESKTSRPLKFLITLLSSVIGLLLAELLFRAYLYHQEPYYFQNDSLWYLQASPIRFSEEFGFTYIPGTYDGGAIYNRQVTHCWSPMQDWVINERGNSGRIKGRYEDAELRILVFGDSVTQRPRKNERGDDMTWPNFLQDYLEVKLNRSVHVVNFARDGYGVLQMFDLAAVKVAEWKPDLVIIAFISDDLTRDRFWRSVINLDGRQRIMVTRTPDPKPNWENGAEAFLLGPKATDQWCRQLLRSGATDDPIVAELETAVLEGRQRISLLADPFSITSSFIFDQILHGSPYHSTFNKTGPSQMPRHTLTRFDLDQRLVEKVQALEELDVDYMITHLAGYSELKDQMEYRNPDAHSELIQSLAELTGKTIYSTLANIDISAYDVEKIPTDPKGDKHPSLYGHQFYGDVVLNILMNNILSAPPENK